jgi:hypothetical protein
MQPINKKPQYLYHASSNKDIKIFEPRAESARHPKEGPKVFATETPEEASKFIVPANDSWSSLGAFSNEHERFSFAIYADRTKFDQLDSGGAIYTLPSNSFEIDAQFSGSSKEWTSKLPVKPVGKEVSDSALNAMLNFGVQVYFVTSNQLEKIQKAKDHGYSIIQKLLSENKVRNINYKALN